MLLPAIRRRLFAPGLAVIAHDLRDPDPVVLKNFGAASGLRISVHFQIAPCGHCLFVPPERQRKELLRIAQTLETLYRNETVDLG